MQNRIRSENTFRSTATLRRKFNLHILPAETMRWRLTIHYFDRNVHFRRALSQKYFIKRYAFRTVNHLCIIFKLLDLHVYYCGEYGIKSVNYFARPNWL